MMDCLIKNKDTVKLYSKLVFYRRMDLLRSKKSKKKKGETNPFIWYLFFKYIVKVR